MKYNRENVLNTFDDNDSYNDFYASVSVLFRIVSFIFLLAFLIFIVYSAFGNQSDFSYDNFEYIIRNFALTLSEKRDENVYSIRYNPDSSRSYSLLGDNFALCGNSGIMIYSSTGRITCSDSFSFMNPVLVSSDKYALVYDSGNYDLVIYNSFSKVHSQSAEKPIRKVCMSQNGYYALISSSSEYNSIVEVYNDNFKLVNRFNKSGYVVDIDMNNDHILIATVENSEDHSLFDVEMLMYSIAEGKSVSSVEITSSFPLSAKIMSSGFFLACNQELIIYDVAADQSDIISYKGNNPSDFMLTYDMAVLLLDIPGYDISYQLLAIDVNGDILYEHDISSTVYDITLCGSDSCLLTDNQIIVLNKTTKNSIPIENAESDYQLLSYNSGAMYLCTSSAAPLINIEK